MSAEPDYDYVPCSDRIVEFFVPDGDPITVEGPLSKWYEFWFAFEPTPDEMTAAQLSQAIRILSEHLGFARSMDHHANDLKAVETAIERLYKILGEKL